jgi:CRP/FNR family cyclic AMP-dependent transcriptional regulator
MSHPDGTQIHVSRQELARICGCSREMVGRVLKAMSEDGMINVSGMNIVVFHSR